MQQDALTFSALEKQLLNDYQQSLPDSITPYAEMAKRYAVSEATILKTLQHLQQIGVISRIGAVFKPNTIGVSTLCAMAIPPQELNEMAEIVSKYPQVNHNYEREHQYNLWFVLTAADQAQIDQVLEEISEKTTYPVLNLPMIKDYYINLGFKLKWH